MIVALVVLLAWSLVTHGLITVHVGRLQGSTLKPATLFFRGCMMPVLLYLVLIYRLIVGRR